jgi:hypothetical protein
MKGDVDPMPAQNRLEVSDETLADAAVAFVLADERKRDAAVARRDLIARQPCVTNEDGPVDGDCFRRERAGRVDGTHAFTVAQACDRCLGVMAATRVVKRASAQRNGKLRRLRNLVRKRTEVASDNA